ncbi:hypothetical protein CCHOA_11645 [Corynebacterium choanae]|uniref:Uncharacterized protein n=1 Tax=Corynebacterium choanae TaxID=1862358 RepID=A0A3G6JDF7_9CORY|nr:hypothetical protein CCHOA_11645 [Corynebacterium choanae]
MVADLTAIAYSWWTRRTIHFPPGLWHAAARRTVEQGADERPVACCRMPVEFALLSLLFTALPAFRVIGATLAPRTLRLSRGCLEVLWCQ